MSNILFDLDGTLSDPKLGITRSIQFALQELGRDIPRADDLTWCIGPPLLGSLEALLGNRADAEIALTHYRERFSAIGIRENELYPGISDCLSSLKADGHRLFVATSKPKVFADRIIEQFELTDRFEAIYGPGLDETRSGKTEILQRLLGKERLDPRRTTMVGDRSHDIVAGLENNLSTLGVLYGYGSEAELRTAGAAILCHKPQDLFDYLGG
ncbi:MAG: HAD hydrolase-like protein [Hyphomicrobiaceae bacterium]